MHLKTDEKFCTILLGMGGPEKTDDVPKYL